LRNTGKVPGVLYGVDEDQNVVKILVTVDEKAVSKEMRDRYAREGQITREHNLKWGIHFLSF
jgi:ribosomal protein L25 (general stress protein Ctc)